MNPLFSAAKSNNWVRRKCGVNTIHSTLLCRRVNFLKLLIVEAEAHVHVLAALHGNFEWDDTPQLDTNGKAVGTTNSVLRQYLEDLQSVQIVSADVAADINTNWWNLFDSDKNGSFWPLTQSDF